jgi:hypothetical protein
MKELQHRWRCERKACNNFSKYCYISSEDNEHFSINGYNLSCWGSAIKKGIATVDKPSEYVFQAIRRESRRHSKASTDISLKQEHKSPSVNVHSHLYMPSPDGMYGYHPATHSAASRFTQSNAPDRSSPPPMELPSMKENLQSYTEWLASGEQDSFMKGMLSAASDKLAEHAIRFSDIPDLSVEE